VPRLRFPEFRDAGEWEEKKFGEICKFIRGPFGGSLKKDMFVKDGYAVYEQSHAIHQNYDSFRYYITKEKFNELKRFSVHPDEIIMSCSGTMGKFSIIPSGSKTGVINQALLKLTVNKELDIRFVKTTMELSSNQEKLLSQSAGGAIKNVVSVSQIKEIDLYIPSLLEQQKIADCLSSIDELITAHSQKHEALKAHKKGLMQQLFPAEGETVPKLRFPEFRDAGEWKENNLGELASFFKGKGLPKSALTHNGKNLCIHYGELFTEYSEVIEKIKNHTDFDNGFLSEKNDVLMPTSDVTPNGLAKACCVNLDGVILGGDILIIRTDKSEVNGEFLSRYIRFKEQKVLQLVTGSTVFHLYASAIDKLVVVAPYIDEQQKIADCLSSIDDLITAQSQKIEALKAHKKGLMQQLLPATDDDCMDAGGRTTQDAKAEVGA